MKYKSYLTEIENRLIEFAEDFPPPRISYYNSDLPMLAEIPGPVKRKLFKDEFQYPDLSEKEQLKLWSYIWKNGIYMETLGLSLTFYEKRYKKLNLDDWKILKSWSQRIDNWAHGDQLCSYYAKLYEEFPKEIEPTLLKWNQSKKPWLRRLSIVSLFYYSSMRKTRQPRFNLARELVLNLIDDQHKYVQKGVGWTLREMYNVYPEKTLKLIYQYASDIPPQGWQAATEKLPKATKEELKKIRKSIS